MTAKQVHYLYAPDKLASANFYVRCGQGPLVNLEATTDLSLVTCKKCLKIMAQEKGK